MTAATHPADLRFLHNSMLDGNRRLTLAMAAHETDNSVVLLFTVLTSPDLRVEPYRRSRSAPRASRPLRAGSI